MLELLLMEQNPAPPKITYETYETSDIIMKLDCCFPWHVFCALEYEKTLKQKPGGGF